MKAIILAAGRGSRMGDLTAAQPKCFAQLRGRRLLDWQLEALHGAQIDEIAVVRGYRAEAFTEALAYFDNPRWESTNMVVSLACAKSWIAADTCIVSYSDIFYSADAVRRLREAHGDIAITYDPNWLEVWRRRFAAPLSDAETFRLRPDGTLAEIGARPTSLDQVQGQYMGLLKFTPAGWNHVRRLIDELGPAADKLDMTGMLGRLIARGIPICAVPITDAWGEVDSESDLASYQ